ncbi:FAD-dependent monooxygenase [Pseudonocardia sp. T1-2H]|uniref:FAD-dependent monooxygenase n=1 Tax=Pseudonocardia sp. T1-2H TaxID=3128899 RepID=UPI0031012EE0
MNPSPSSPDAPDDRGTPRVLVVGAGPTGLVAALLLADLGVASTVVDRRSAPHRLPRAVHLDDECVRILQSAGVAEEFAAISRPATGLRLLDGRLRPFAVFPGTAPRDATGGRSPTCSTSPNSRSCCSPRPPAGRW